MKSLQRFSRVSVLFINCGCALGCGYRAAYAERSVARMSVAAGDVLVPDAAVVAAAMSGARAELERAGALDSSSSYPRLVIDLLRVDEVSNGVVATSAGPIARGMGVAVVARGRVLRQPDAPPDSDSGDLRRTSYLDGDADPRTDSTLHDGALRAAAERAGRDVARAALGLPEPAEESL